ncbi:hypothetical protein KPL71_007943 [Citrus sinensis]|uniref:Uncharacterized protein n=1 Tax=Citrus sinensis TaxID=2711 RepID=A0ACB8M2Y6_CITSI|nr:hypothetical protein KPL71_007943 [Citrus sinensis]
MTLKTAKEIWDFLKQEYEGNDRVKGMQVLNLILEFEMQKMKESETIQKYSDRLFKIVNKVRLIGTDFSDSRVVQKILVMVPEKFKATISSLENSRDLSSITLAELLNAQQALEQMRLMRQEGSLEGVFQAKSQNNKGGKNKKNQNKDNKLGGSASRHVERICKTQQQQSEAKAIEDQPQEEQLFVVSCFATNSSTENWLIDSGCTNYMTYDRELFTELDATTISKVRIGNGAHIAVKGKRTVAIEGHTGLKLIYNVLYVLELNQNLFSVTQLLEKGYKVLFEDKNCVIKDAKDREVFKVQMKGKSFALDLMKEEQASVHREDSNTLIWHKRLGHFHHITLLYMKKNNLVKDLPELEEESSRCAACQYGKQTRIPFQQNKAWRAIRRLQLIHTDVGGPTKTPSLNNTANDQKWIATMKDELKMIEKNQTWELEDRPEHKKAIGVKWVYRTKLNPDGSVNKHKASLIFKGYAQMFGVDFSETFAPIARLDTIRMSLALAAQQGWVIHQMDVKSAFLNGYLEEEIFVEQPEGFVFPGQEEKADNEILVVSLYVDDLLVTGSSKKLIDRFKEEMKDVFEMTDLGRMTFFLGMQAAKIILRYIKGTIDYGIRFNQVKNFNLHGYSNSDWAGCVDDMRSTSGYYFSFGSEIVSGIVSWCSKKQEVIAQSTAEAEYVAAAAAAVNQALWIRKLMTDLHMEQQEGTQIFVDN